VRSFTNTTERVEESETERQRDQKALLSEKSE
jgi:hypothetical protein